MSLYLLRRMLQALSLLFVTVLLACVPPTDTGNGEGNDPQQEVPVDSDGDGVRETDDQCPDTALAAEVDARGCASAQRDTDRDGIADDLDACPETGRGEMVGADGCVVIAKPVDSDGDGVPDDRDECPGTAIGTSVAVSGCAIVVTPADSDGDGVANADDDCPATQLGLNVNTAGCAANQRDADRDGVPDNRDRCPGTPSESAVDSRGCTDSQRDADGDGISDALDICAATVSAAPVDARGCSAAQRDLDRDGIPDDLDACPGTTAGLSVLANGCSPAPAVNGGGGGAAGPGGECAVAEDCSDANACTTDSCGNGSCAHAAITDCVPCSVPPICPLVEVVFIMDTSGSMTDEAVALCTGIAQVVTALEALGIVVQPTFLGITESPGGPFTPFTCLTDNVVALLGAAVPGNAQACPFPGALSAFESWGPATAIVAERFPWTPAARRVIVPISDEGPCNGNLPEGCNDPGDDRDSILNAIAVANLHGAAISPVTGTDSDSCVLTLAAAAAAGTGGTTFNSTDPIADLAGAIYEMILRTCDPGACDDQNACTVGDVCANGVCAGTPTKGCMSCHMNGDCDDDNACTDNLCTDGICEYPGNYDPALYCCDPVTGGLTPLSDDSLCTADVCDPGTGMVTHPPANEGMTCDDGNDCTQGDQCAGGACAGSPIPSCRECAVREDCDDQSVCTSDFCDNGFCNYRNNHHPAISCCDPVTGALTPISDLDPCTGDICDPDSGMVAHPPQSGATCDDGLNCTINDRCIAGQCRGDDVDEVNCTSNTDCPSGACDLPTGKCDCVDETPLCLNLAAKVCSTDAAPCLTDADCTGRGVCVCDDPADDHCVDDGQTITLKLEIQAGSEIVTGGQFYFSYDAQCLDFQDIGPCPGEEIFVFVLRSNADEANGFVFYAAVSDPGTIEIEGTAGPHTIACAHFTRRLACSPRQACIIPDSNPQETILVDPMGNRVPYHLCPCDVTDPLVRP